MKALSGPFQVKDLGGYAFLGTLLVGGLSVTFIAMHQMNLYMNLLSAPSPRKTKIRFPYHTLKGRASRTLEVLDESEQNAVAEFQIMASTHEDLREFPQLCEFDFYLKEQNGTQRAIFTRKNYVLIAYKHKATKLDKGSS